MSTVASKITESEIKNFINKNSLESKQESSQDSETIPNTLTVGGLLTAVLMS